MYFVPEAFYTSVALRFWHNFFGIYPRALYVGSLGDIRLVRKTGRFLCSMYRSRLIDSFAVLLELVAVVMICIYDWYVLIALEALVRNAFNKYLSNLYFFAMLSGADVLMARVWAERIVNITKVFVAAAVLLQ
jgi:hypothetical protein